MWAKIESNTVKEIIGKPKALVIGDVQHPSNIFSMWSDSELYAIGIVPVTMDYTNRKDLEYYINTEITYAYNAETKKVTGSFGTATAKPLDHILFTAQDEIDGKGTEGEIKQPGIRQEHKESVNTTARNLLQPTDWLVIREADGGTAMPSNIKTYRAAVRTKANTHCTSIDNASDVDALAALTFDWPTEVS